MYLFAQFISIISNPLIFSFPMAFALVYKTTQNYQTAFFWAIISFLVTFTIALFVLYGVRRGFFSDFDVSIQSERKPLFIFGAIVVLMYGLTLYFLNGPKVLLVALSGVALGIFADSVINMKIKASIHVATYSAFSGAMALLYGGYVSFLLVLIPLVAWSRITIKRHSLQETVIGAILGLSLITIMYVLLKLLVQ